METSTTLTGPTARGPYFPLEESGMSKDLLRGRLQQWWGQEQDKPWVQRRLALLERPWPFYTTEELQDLCDLLLHDEERAALARARSAAPDLVRRCAQVYQRYEAAALRIVQWLDQLDHADGLGITARAFFDFPGGPPEGGMPGDTYTLVFPYNMRVLHLQEGELTYFVCPRDGQVMKITALRQVFLVEGQERTRILRQTRTRVPWLLVGTPRAVSIGELPDDAP
jgi:hypothetical protein